MKILVTCSEGILKDLFRVHWREKKPFLANDVTLVTSYGYCQSLKINDRREQCRVCLTICWGIFSETRGGGVHRDTETLTLSAAQTHTANVMGVRPPVFEVFCIRKCGSTSNACFVYARSGGFYSRCSPVFTEAPFT